ncbi:MAG: diaminopimelate decarboxylase [Candidatus Cryptobacteroides sp.]
MLKGQFPVEKFASLRTPFYYYDLPLLRRTLDKIRECIEPYPQFHVHYAVKANFNGRILQEISRCGFGADCVSGGEIRAALQNGFAPESIVYAGVGKSDEEILLALDAGIARFNVESAAELEVINELALSRGVVAPVSLRVNPDIGAHTHANITTGLAENKFGINYEQLPGVIELADSLPGVEYKGLHFHIGSQILEMDDFVALCNRINVLAEQILRQRRGRLVPAASSAAAVGYSSSAVGAAGVAGSGVAAGVAGVAGAAGVAGSGAVAGSAAGVAGAAASVLGDINVGGGLGINYYHPNHLDVAEFSQYFETFARHLKLPEGTPVHFELGRSVVAPCGSLISRVLYIKEGTTRRFAIIDASMTELIRPALYKAYHRVENISSYEPEEVYDVVGPVCESSDVFAKGVSIDKCHRGDFIAIRSAGAYGESMSSQYNCRPLPACFFKED